jgi:TPR repeat protein
MSPRLSLMLLILCGVLGHLTGTAFPRDEQAYQRAKAAYDRQDYATALREWRPLAQQGDPHAQVWLGHMYELGRGVTQNDTEAVKWYRKAADQGDARGQYNLGVMYAEGRGVVGDDAEAVKWYQKAADQGYAPAQSLLGYMYSRGRGMARDDAEAVKWYRKAADQGLDAAEVSLGQMYEQGRGVAQNDAEAVKWYRKAADQGDAYGQYSLGVMYTNGRGVTQNNAEAVKWYRKAADQGHTHGQYNLGHIYELGRGVTQNDAEAVKWYRKAADQDDADAQANLGYMYAQGRGVTQDLAEAQRWFAKAAEAYPPGINRSDVIQARERVARQLATAQTPAPSPVPGTPAVAPASQTPYRRALVIGNTKYPQNPLRNPVHDANAMAKFLAQEAGFTVYKGRALMDMDRQTLVNAISDFADSIRRGDIVVFYFSGHGLERNGQNYLIPINFAAQNAAQLPYEAPTAQDIQKQLVAGEPDMMIMILDACRDLPEEFKSLRGRAGGRGLGFMSAVSGSTAQQVIMFATAPGTTAADGGTLGNGTFTHCFLQSFQRPGMDSRIAFGDVVQCVLDKTNQEQNPFLVTSQRQRFVFK